MLRRFWQILIALVLGVNLFSGVAAAQPTLTEFELPPAINWPYVARPHDITSGPDGALWYTDSPNDLIGRVSTTGDVTQYFLAPGYQPYKITSGPDGALWFTGYSSKKIGRITTSGAISEFSLPPTSGNPLDITTGPDGALWYTSAPESVGRITTSGVITEFAIPRASDGRAPQPFQIVSGPDGALWFTTQGVSSRAIGRITTTGDLTLYPTISGQHNASGITVGPDGALWFTTTSNNVGRIDINGTITSYLSAENGPNTNDIVVGPDGNLWYTNRLHSSIDRITTTGVVTHYPVPTSIDPLGGLTTGPDGALWFTEPGNAKIGRFLIEPPDSTPPAVAGIVDVAPNNAGWNNSDVTIDWTASDPEPSSGTPTDPPDTMAATEGQDVVYTSDPSCDAANNCATGSLTLSIDKTAPTTSNLALSTNPKTILETSELTVNAADGLSGVQEVEYFIGEDPGQGNGADMFFDGTTATVTIGTDMPVGVYSYSVRALDNAGNWSDPQTVFLTVYDPSGGFVTATRMFTPSLAAGDILPGLTDQGQTTKANFGLTVKYQNGSLQGNNNDFMMDYKVGNGCQNPNSNCTGINVDSTSIDWLILTDNATKGTFQGTADVTVNSTTTTSNPYRVEIRNSDSLTAPNTIVVRVYAVGADPNTADPIYKASGTVTGNINVQQL